MTAFPSADMNVPNPGRNTPSISDPRRAGAISTPTPAPAPWYTHTESPSYSPIKLDIDLDIPAFGLVFMNPPEEAIDYATTHQSIPVYQTLLNGQLVIKLSPPGCSTSSFKYESIKIGFRAESRVYRDINKGKAELETLYETVHDLPSGVIRGQQR
jgi:hypothetical protein